jgi:hypothetical protein
MVSKAAFVPGFIFSRSVPSGAAAVSRSRMLWPCGQEVVRRIFDRHPAAATGDYHQQQDPEDAGCPGGQSPLHLAFTPNWISRKAMAACALPDDYPL